MNSLDLDTQETSSSLVSPASAYSQIMQGGDYGPIKKKKKSHSKGKSGKYNADSPARQNKGAASSLAWIDWLIGHRDTDVFRRLETNLGELRRQCAVPDPDAIGCMLTDVHGSDHRRTSTEAFRQQIDGLGEEAKQLPVRVSVHILALVLAGRGPPERPPPRHPSSNKQAFWVASHLCHNKSCTQPDHLVWEPNWANRQRDGCLGGSCCVHLPYKCIRAHRRPVDNVDWSRL
jgi:hypothetical protein